ncbi:helix-turn-helix transcriptional regulator [Mycolicibacterium litorale]|uniref:Transcriptional regulator n=1 Tax=Mycolicibacterium litorale TaxID=758802 RepID=A0AAD1MT02_9MYCO|nr:LuxR C-terminal-related transcriptional regulator [Mycolicibacterium litorale]MCV7416562.1 tetratricopeptide repeat protein [Mycolicibacterium litorale]TDY09815.1 LuxR family transcriptional regulator [Mycolicibacterium litorale]BBY17774.1 transcriptional regulator [Mycolicibacterium litorale]
MDVLRNTPAGSSAVAEFLNAVPHGPAGLLVEGEAGIGKTRLWLSGVEEAHRRGYRVLSARAGQAETSLAYAAVADLLEDVDPEITAHLPVVQRLALDRLLLRGDADGPETDHRVAAAAVLSTVETLCQAAPLIVAVDDVQWLDVCSRDVLGFVARRLSCPVGLLLTERTEESLNHTEWLQLAQPDRLRRHRVAPLSLGGLHAMLSERLGRSYPRPTLIRIAETSGGNPLYALELARAMAEQTAAGEPTLPASLTDVVRRRIQGIDEVVRDVLLAAACVAAPTVDLVASATEKTPEEVLELLEAAEAQGLVEIDGLTVRFAHPLLARGVYSEAGPARRRHMHRRLAGVISQPEQKARHLALAATSQDDDTLAALDAAANAARARGAPAAAAELLEFAMRLGGDTDLRRLQAAAHYFTAGDSGRAEELLESTLPRMPHGPLRAIASMQLAGIVIDHNDFHRGLGLLDEALADCESDQTLEVHCLLSLSMAQTNAGDHEPALRNADRAVAIAEQTGQLQLIGQALTVRLFVRFIFGFGVDQQELQRALDAEDPNDEVPLPFRATVVAGLLNSWTGRLDEAYATLQDLRRRSLDRGADRDLLAISVSGTLLELWRGRLDEAATYADDAVERAEQVGGENSRLVALGVRAIVSAFAGRVRAARADAEAALDMARRSEVMRMTWWPLGVLIFLEVSLGNYPQALVTLEPLMDDFLRTPGNEIFGSFFVPDAVEALVAVGRSAEAQPLIERFENDGRRLDRPWLSAVAGRCRGMDLAARGDVDGAVAAVTEAMTHHDRLPMPFERARTALLLGQLQRRQRRKEAAAATLGESLATFESIGAALWAQRAREELARVNVRPTRDQGLTPSERRVAELAASGMSNRDIAAALFISVKTVEANLGRVYRKLGVRGRVALARRLEE